MIFIEKAIALSEKEVIKKAIALTVKKVRYRSNTPYKLMRSYLESLRKSYGRILASYAAGNPYLGDTGLGRQVGLVTPTSGLI
ncbi:MAG: hypothetical protein QNJ32_11775 [Xenococcaceae cyanobacterium MO_167.B27]|nr:hypothetical protein [Xenococcaceae cyanobacterium MO_167.B27]